ncbi:MAG: hypothetical protein LDL50_00150, partial [Chloroflexi bacterium]|nr:hypothetical protein [Chloroflexota bacterium]
AGSLFVLVPSFFADWLKPRAAVVLAFFLALDPGLVALSRQVASPILAIVFPFAALGFYLRGKTALAAVFAAFALLSGPSIWGGLLVFVMVWVALRLLRFNRPQLSTFNPQPFLLPFLAAFLLAGSLFFLVPSGLSAALASIPAFVQSWLGASSISAGRLLFSLLIYQPLGVLLAVLAVFRGWKNGSRRILPLGVWFLAALLLAIVNPSRRIEDLAWALIPLWALAALELIRSLDIFPEERRATIGAVFLTVFIWTFAWLDFAGLAILPVNSREYLLRLWLLFGSLFLLIMSLVLAAAGWSIRVARLGCIWGLVLALTPLGVGGAVGAAGLRGANFPELWWLPDQPVHARLLEATVSDVSEWGLGDDHAAAVTIAGLDSPALEWLLRERPVSVVQSLDSASAPEIVITPLQDDPALSFAYRGQDFAWRQTPLWDVTVPADWARWTVLRQMPASGETIILWVRDDLFINSPR